jgi:capsular exopolysaccharide synthesis family protein
MHNHVYTAPEKGNPFAPADFVSILSRRRATVFWSLVLALLACVALIALTAPVYRATAHVLVEEPRNSVNTVDTSNPLSDLLDTGQQPSLATHVKLLQSQELAKSVAARMNVPLDRLPKFRIEPVKDTQVIEISADDTSPRRAVSATDLLVQTYLDNVLNFKDRELLQALALTTEQTQQAQRDLTAIEAELAAFKHKNAVADLEKNRDAQMKEVAELQSLEEKTAASLAASRAEVATTQQQLALEPPEKNDVVSAAADPAVQALQAKVADLKAQQAGLAQRYKPGYFKRQPLDAQIASMEAELKHEEATVGARNARRNPTYTALHERLQTLVSQADGLAESKRDVTTRLGQAQIKLDSYASLERDLAGLQRQLDTARVQYQTLSHKRDDLRLRTQVPHLNARVFHKALLDKDLVYPKKLQILVFAVILGLSLGWGIALLQEYFDDRVLSAGLASRLLRLPVLANIPVFPLGQVSVEGLEPLSPLAEAYRRLSTAIEFAATAGNNPVPVIGIASPGRGDGRSTTVANLAALSALDGRRVLVVDADLRNPVQQALLGGALTPGLTEYLQGRCTLVEAIQPTGVDGVSVICAGSEVVNPVALFRSEAMRHLRDAVREHADLVLFDTPPLIGSTEAVVLGAKLDGMVLLLSHGDSRLRAMLEANNLLARVGCCVLGLALNRAPKDADSAEYTAPVGELPALSARNGSWHRGGRGVPRIALSASAPGVASDHAIAPSNGVTAPNGSMAAGRNGVSVLAAHPENGAGSAVYLKVAQPPRQDVTTPLRFADGAAGSVPSQREIVLRTTIDVSLSVDEQDGDSAEHPAWISATTPEEPESTEAMEVSDGR